MMKIELLLLCYCFWSAAPHGRCSEPTLSSRRDEKHTDQQLVIDSSREVESQSSSSSQIPDIVPVSAGPHVSGSGRDCASSDSCSTDSLVSDACDAAEELPFDSTLPSFPAVQENVSVRETRKPAKDQTRKRSNASHVLKDQGSSDTDPSVPCPDQEIPTFDEWTKIMMETEKSQVTPHAPDGKKLQQTITNYASVECGAKILSSNPEAKSTSAVLMENMDMYMLNPCNNKIWFIIELCQPIQVKQLDIANFEIFSSNPKDFLVSISDRYPNKKWVKLGTFHARDERMVQSFPLDEHLFAKYVKMFTRYIKVELLSHFGSEHFCPLSLIRVFGTSMMEEYELNSEPSDRHTHSHDDYDQPPDFLPVDDKSSKNLIGSAKDALLTMVNNIAANVLGGHPESAGNSSTEGLNASDVVLPAGAMHSGPVADQLDVTGVTETVSITSATHTDAPTLKTRPAEDGPIRTEPDAEQIVTLLPETEYESDQSSGAEMGQTEPQNGRVNVNALRSESHAFSLQEYLLQRCSVQKRKTDSRSRSRPAVIMSTITESPVILTPDARSELQSVMLDLAPSLTSDLLVSTDRLSVESVSECLTATLPPQSTDRPLESGQNHVKLSDLMTRSSGDQVDREQISATSSLKNDISTPTLSISPVDESQSVSAPVDEAASVTLTPAEAAHPSDGPVESAEAKSKELVDDEGSTNMEQPSSEIYGETLNSSEVPAHGSSQKESVFMRLNNRIKALEMNMSLSGRYLEQLSQRYRKQVEEMQRAFNKTIIKLQNTSRTAEEQDQRQTDSIQVLQAQLENVTRLVLGLSVSVSHLQQEVSDRQSYILLCLVLCVLLALLICVNYRQMCESPALDTHRSCCPERELLSDEEPVILRRRASDPPSLSSLQKPEGGSEETSSLKQWEQGPVSRKKKHKLKLSRSPETRAAPPVTGVIPQSTIGPQEVRDVMSDGSEASSHSDETLFCGITSCTRLCEKIPVPGRWTQSRRQKTAEQLHQPPQRSDLYNLTHTGHTDPHWTH
ncbi:SUN domain-containing ossification factor-like isoform X2 [Ctenopharyngodon idella]|uniref:SUN domain-containing ossification factor-like isoform X2 n=1 Tax=Ctenopharyngodon idella TaxID=7959 RepID=UPI0022322554|nr:SUN domain-containing ossification factor-like isoform X2 [Ctenopharyngodon idella]